MKQLLFPGNLWNVRNPTKCYVVEMRVRSFDIDNGRTSSQDFGSHTKYKSSFQVWLRRSLTSDVDSGQNYKKFLSGAKEIWWKYMYWQTTLFSSIFRRYTKYPFDISGKRYARSARSAQSFGFSAELRTSYVVLLAFSSISRFLASGNGIVRVERLPFIYFPK